MGNYRTCPDCLESEAGPGRAFDHSYDLPGPKVVPCPRCDGEGYVSDEAAGLAEMRAERDPALTFLEKNGFTDLGGAA